jgi:hypothetical protein
MIVHVVVRVVVRVILPVSVPMPVPVRSRQPLSAEHHVERDTAAGGGQHACAGVKGAQPLLDQTGYASRGAASRIPRSPSLDPCPLKREGLF